MDIVGYGTKGTGKGLLPDPGSLLTCGTTGECTPWEISPEKRELGDFKATAAVAEQLGK